MNLQHSQDKIITQLRIMIQMEKLKDIKGEHKKKEINKNTKN